MSALQGAVEATAPVSRLHAHRSFSLDDFPVPTGREEEWRFTPVHSSAKGTTSGQRRLRSAPPRRLTLCMGS
jgi:hypothetical protein